MPCPPIPFASHLTSTPDCAMKRHTSGPPRFSRQRVTWHAIALQAIILLVWGCGSTATQPATTNAKQGSAGAAATSAEATPKQPDSSKQTESADTNASQPGASANLRVVRLSDAELNDGWILLFDEQTLFGWEPGSKANWKVENGIISVDDGEPGLLCTTSEFADYVLKVDFRFAPGTNSGIFLHTPVKPTDPASDCYELNIAEPAVSEFSTGSFVKRSKAEATAAPDTWHSYEVTMEGGRCTVKLNGTEVLNYTDAQPLLRGRIGLQLNKGRVEFRNIRLRPLGVKPLLNGKDLAGWKEGPNSASKFTVRDDGSVHVSGGRGYLESEQSYGDFVGQLQCQTHVENQNSGFFFRCIPGEELNGYESQIQNGYQHGDRSQPADAGTGAIFRRTTARLVVADDKKWFHKTLVAVGPHISVWVDGFQVTDWTDTRAADPNPRKGVRTDAGTFMLQGHDPGTDVSFRNIVAVELPPRRSQ
ncbi:MAG: hypothetical protein RIS70_3084 [Planctomycetota bacterium]